MTAAAGVVSTAPSKQSIAFRKGIVTELQIVVPAGHAGLTGIRFTLASTTLLPITKGSWIITDDEIIRWPLAGFLESGAWGVEYYNEDIHAHDWFIRLLINEARVATPIVTLPGSSPAESELTLEPEEGGGGGEIELPAEEGATAPPEEEPEEEPSEAEEEEEQVAEEEEEAAEEEEELGPEPGPEEGYEPGEEEGPVFEAPSGEFEEEEPELSGGAGGGGPSDSSPAASGAPTVAQLKAVVKQQVKEIAKLRKRIKNQPHSRFVAEWRHELKVDQRLIKKNRAKIKAARAEKKAQALKAKQTKATEQLAREGDTRRKGGGGEHEKQRQEKEKKERIRGEQAERTPEEKLAKKRSEIARLQGEIGGLQGDMNRLQGEIGGLQNHISQLTNVLQEHPRAVQRGQWESERNSDRTNIEGKRQRISEDQANIDHKRSEVEFWNNW